MTHYAYVLSVDRLQMDVRIGFYEKERETPQTVEVSFRLYFAEAIASNSNDEAHFFDYGKLSAALLSCVEGKRYNLIEYLGMELFRHLRTVVDAEGGAQVKLWLQLNKIHAPVARLMGGASFIHSDLPADATFIPSAQL